MDMLYSLYFKLCMLEEVALSHCAYICSHSALMSGNDCVMFAGKVCKLEKTIGQALNKTIGGDAFSIDISKNLLSIPHQLSTSLLPGKTL